MAPPEQPGGGVGEEGHGGAAPEGRAAGAATEPAAEP
eukprot:gene43934-108_t